MDNKKEKHNYLIIGTVLAFVVAMFVLIVVWFFTNNRETRISEDVSYGAIASLECESTKSEDAFFKPYGAIRVKHKIISTFKGDNFDNMSYEFEGVYNSEDRATSAEAWLHADYNSHFRDTDVNPESYSPNFAVLKNKVRIAIYADRRKLNNMIAPIFYLFSEDYNKLEKLSREDFEKVYENKGFACILREGDDIIDE